LRETQHQFLRNSIYGSRKDRKARQNADDSLSSFVCTLPIFENPTFHMIKVLG
jgi:hypothetical protein